jgi:hypothetical protein
MKCLEFKTLVLSTPNSEDLSFIAHSKDCPDCLKYVAEVRKMDADLSNSLDVAIPSDLVARLLLKQAMSEEPEGKSYMPRYAIAASVAIALFVGGFMFSNQFALNDQVGDDYQSLLSGVVEHMGEQAVTPVWQADRANNTVNTLLASYDTKVRFKYMENLQFGRICPMGEYRGLHASLETDNGQITFAFIKGDSLGDLIDAGYEGYVTRIKPISGGNLIIISRNHKSLEQAESQLDEAIYWDI